MGITERLSIFPAENPIVCIVCLYLRIVSAGLARCAGERVVRVVGFLVEPRLDAGLHALAQVAVDVQVLTEARVAEGGRVERRLSVVELTTVRPLLRQLRQLAAPTLSLSYRIVVCVYIHCKKYECVQ